MCKDETEKDNVADDKTVRTSSSGGRHCIFLGRGEVNLSYLKKFGNINIEGVGSLELVLRDGRTIVSFTPSKELYSFLKEHNYGNREKRSTRKR